MPLSLTGYAGLELLNSAVESSLFSRPADIEWFRLISALKW